MEADNTSATSSSKAQNFVELDEYDSKYIYLSVDALLDTEITDIAKIELWYFVTYGRLSLMHITAALCLIDIYWKK